MNLNKSRWLILLAAFIPMHANSAGQGARLKVASRNVVNLLEWRFQPDPKNIGIELGWAKAGFDDAYWPVLKATDIWEAQGFAQFSGAGWYRYAQEIPAAWAGSKILLQTMGIYDEYDLYVNGVFLKHFGSKDQGVAWDPTEPELTSYLKYGEKNEIALRVTSHGPKSGIYRRVLLRRVAPFDPYKKFLPAPILDDHPELVNLYWQSWRMAFKNVSFGNPVNDFVPAYMEEGYNEQIYQWDSIFMSMYGRYGSKLFPAMNTLDNFYKKQDPNGYIARIYSKTDGKKLVEPVDNQFAVTNPPLFAWSEWDYFRMTGDDKRLPRVLPVLERYDAWLKSHQRSPLVKGMYWQTDYDSGMDNMPRPNMDMAGWLDMTMEQAVAAKYLALIAHHLKDTTKERYWRNEYEDRKDTINRLAWSDRDGFYYDVDKDGKQTGVKHIGAIWALLSDVASPEQAKKLVEHLKNPSEFYRPHLFPALSASDPGFTKEATYWRGGVWAPTNYMAVRGLKEFGYGDFAHEAALNHLSNMAKVYSSKIDTHHVDPNEAKDDYRTIWECYNPDQVTPCTRADAHNYGRQDFAGWTALGPIALLIQQGIGLEIIGAENRIEWTLREPGRTGIKNMELRHGNTFSLLAEREQNGARLIRTKAQKPFTLLVMVNGKAHSFPVPAGASRFTLNR